MTPRPLILAAVLALAACALPIEGERAFTAEAAGHEGRLSPGDEELLRSSATLVPLEATAAPGDAVQVELYRWHDFAVEAPGVGGNKFDVEGQIVWTHQPSGERRISRVWYQGSGDTFVYRFGAPFQGLWTGTTASPVAALDGIELAVNVTPSSNPNRTGWSGRLAGEPTAWARQQGPDGALVRSTPRLVMWDLPRHFWNKLDKMRSDAVELLDCHGFNGVHMPSIGRGWFDVTSAGELDDALSDPDPRTFAALEALILEVVERGGWVHFWMWGKGDGDFNKLSGGYSGAVSRRINRYLGARLGPVPGWYVGIGYDNEFWTNTTQLKWWMEDLVGQFGGYHHWVGGRFSDCGAGGCDPEPANWGEYRAPGIAWNTLIDGHHQFQDWEQWAPLTSDEALERMYQVSPDRPGQSGDRFRYRDPSPWPVKDMPSAAAILSWLPRFASRGIASIWGNYGGGTSTDRISEPWPNRANVLAMQQQVEAGTRPVASPATLCSG